ncbi:MAG TPA: riboflavin kinase [Patescibacteria group bacterium]
METISAKVIHGEKVGRTIGFPTANLDIQLTEEDLKPGVYLAKVTSDQDRSTIYNGLAYFGPRYIFGEQVNSFEVYLYDFEGDLYNQTLEIALTDYLREPMNLDSIDKLRAQLELDKAEGLKLLQSH